MAIVGIYVRFLGHELKKNTVDEWLFWIFEAFFTNLKSGDHRCCLEQTCKRSWEATFLGSQIPKTNSSPLKMMVSNRNLLFQGSIFRGYVGFKEGMFFMLVIPNGYHRHTLEKRFSPWFPPHITVGSCHTDDGKTFFPVVNEGLFALPRWASGEEWCQDSTRNTRNPDYAANIAGRRYNVWWIVWCPVIRLLMLTIVYIYIAIALWADSLVWTPFLFFFFTGFSSLVKILWFAQKAKNPLNEEVYGVVMANGYRMLSLMAQRSSPFSLFFRDGVEVKVTVPPQEMFSTFHVALFMKPKHLQPRHSTWQWPFPLLCLSWSWWGIQEGAGTKQHDKFPARQDILPIAEANECTFQIAASQFKERVLRFGIGIPFQNTTFLMTPYQFWNTTAHLSLESLSAGISMWAVTKTLVICCV